MIKNEALTWSGDFFSHCSICDTVNPPLRGNATLWAYNHSSVCLWHHAPTQLWPDRDGVSLNLQLPALGRLDIISSSWVCSCGLSSYDYVCVQPKQILCSPPPTGASSGAACRLGLVNKVHVESWRVLLLWCLLWAVREQATQKSCGKRWRQDRKRWKRTRHGRRRHITRGKDKRERNRWGNVRNKETKQRIEERRGWIKEKGH